MQRLTPTIAVFAATSALAFANTTIDFKELSLGAESYYGGAATGAGAFSSKGVTFDHSTNDWSWNGYTYSNQTDSTTPGFGNDGSAITGGGYDDENYGVSYVSDDSFIWFGSGAEVAGMYVTNTTYTGLSMLNGDSFAKQFGGADGTDSDYFKLTINGLDTAGSILGSVDFYLADFRFVDPAEDYVVTGWEYVDLTSLGTINALSFALESTDNSVFAGVSYMNTPSYFAFDNLSFSEVAVVPEPSTYALLLGALALVGALCYRRW